MKYTTPIAYSARRPLHLTVFAALGCTLVFAQGCPSGAELENKERWLDGPSTPDGPECDATPILQQGCGSSICHQGENGMPPRGGVDFFAEGFDTLMIDLPATYNEVTDTENCPDEPESILDSSELENSLLLRKLRGTHSCGDGMPVPFPHAAMDEEDIVCVEKWSKWVVETGGSGAGMGGAGAGGNAATGGSSASGSGSGGMPSGSDTQTAQTTRIEIECAFEENDCGNGILGSNIGSASIQNMTTVGFINAGTQFTFENVNLEGLDQLVVNYSKGLSNAGTFAVYLDDTMGTPIVAAYGPPETPTSGGDPDWTAFEDSPPFSFSEVSGTHTVILVAAGSDSVLNLDWIEFSKK